MDDNPNENFVKEEKFKNFKHRSILNLSLKEFKDKFFELKLNNINEEFYNLGLFYDEKFYCIDKHPSFENYFLYYLKGYSSEAFKKWLLLYSVIFDYKF
jgi:hypothetical protein